MAFSLTDLAQLRSLPTDTVIDARSPGEFAEDHLPGAINLPVLSNDERARVGTIYTRDSPFRARKIGGALVSANIARHLEGPLADRDGGWRPLVYCWRGGQRSGAFAAVLGAVGWRVAVLEGGYRSYRRLVVEALYERPWPGRVVLIDGDTGTAKTALLHRLARRGLQVIDLEGHAAHRGSLLGPGTRPQPDQKAFESALAWDLSGLDPARPVLIEAESSKIGDRLVPPSLWAAMRAAPRIEIAAPPAARAAHLAAQYADSPEARARLLDRLEGLVPFHGAAQVAAWRALGAAGEDHALALALMEAHYDPRYARARARQDPQILARLETARLDAAALDSLAARIAGLLEPGP